MSVHEVSLNQPLIYIKIFDCEHRFESNDIEIQTPAEMKNGPNRDKKNAFGRRFDFNGGVRGD
jgi:hypothetical protein